MAYFKEIKYFSSQFKNYIKSFDVSSEGVMKNNKISKKNERKKKKKKSPTHP